MQQQAAQQFLNQFKENSESWTRVPDILERSGYQQSKASNDTLTHAFTDPSCSYSVYRLADT